MVSQLELEQQLAQWLHPLRMRLVRGEIRQLPSLLWDEENIESAAQGWYQSGLVLLVATNRRLLLVDRKWLDTKVDDFPYGRISSVEHDANIWMGKITVSTPGGQLVVNRINSNNLKHFCRVLVDHITADQTNHTAQIGNLQVLALMLDKGLLTDEEFRAQWRHLLSGKTEKDFLDFRLPTDSTMR